jgi:formate dehydrogenase iron-sulfur subunit
MAQAMGFFTDTTLCIGCKACEVACKEWNQLPAMNGGANTLSGDSYDNTRELNGINWRHVKFIEQFDATDPHRTDGRWLLMSDVCKHCVEAGCLEVCPTGAIIRTEFDTVVIQSDVCNGCRYCIAACPFDVIGINESNNTAMKCTLCYDRLQGGLTPACAQACPTASIQFGPIEELRARANQRVQQLHQRGESRAYLYGVSGDGHTDDIGGLNAFFLLIDRPEVYKLPEQARLPSRNSVPGWIAGWTAGLGSALVAGVVGLLSFRQRRMAAAEAAAVPAGTGERGPGREEP